MTDVKVTKDALLKQAQKAVNIDQLNKLIEEIVDLVVEKNKMYGDAWQLYGPLTALIRIREKLVRLENVVTNSDGEIVVSVKSCKDALEELNDIIGYALLLKLWIAGNTNTGMPHVDLEINTEEFKQAMNEYLAGVARNETAILNALTNCPIEFSDVEKNEPI